MSAGRALSIGVGAVFALGAGFASAATALPKAVDTPALTMTGIGDTIAPPGAARKPLPARAPTDAMTMTGIGDTIAPPGAGRNALPAQVPTEALTMTGVGPAN